MSKTKNKELKALVVATSEKTRGGVTSVIKAHKEGTQWEKYKMCWIETHIDRDYFTKLIYLISAYFKYLFCIGRFDIVHIHLSEPVSAYRKSLFFLTAKLFRKKIILHFHSYSPETTINSKHKKLYKKLFLSADKVIVLSNLWKEWVKEYLGIEENVVVVYNPCPKIGLNVGEIKKKEQILYAGTITKRKGYHDLIRAFALIAGKHPSWILVFAGNGEIDEAKECAKKLGVEQQICFAGWIAGKQKDEIFRESAIFCLPSYKEGFPVSVLDAWAYGLPVITTPVGGLPDIVTDGENALIFNPGDIDTLAEKLEMLISDNLLREKISAVSLLLAQSTFNIDTINKSIGELYDSLKK